jgi:hypothetical protein
MASPTLRVRLLGELDLRHGEAPVPPLGSARAGSLLAYKDRWDPANVFHMNANIPPSGP